MAGPVTIFFTGVREFGPRRPGVNHFVKRVTRFLTACFAAVALVLTLAVVPAWACEATHESGAVTLTATSPVEHSTGDSDCGETSSQAPTQHATDCLLTCVSMAGCGSPGLASQWIVDDVAATESIAPLSLVDSYPSRSLAPDRPPPRQ